VIDEALDAIAELGSTGEFARIIYSAADEGGQLGTGIFTVGSDVRAYIVQGLRRVAADASGAT
jgi:hypothetical protein